MNYLLFVFWWAVCHTDTGFVTIIHDLQLSQTVWKLWTFQNIRCWNILQEHMAFFKGGMDKYLKNKDYSKEFKKITVLLWVLKSNCTIQYMFLRVETGLGCIVTSLHCTDVERQHFFMSIHPHSWASASSPWLYPALHVTSLCYWF